MQTLKFLGRGSAFNIKEGNTSAYIKNNKHLLLIDCGENIFDRIIKTNLLDGIEKVDVLITHLNSDHVGSLSSLIYYCAYIKKFKINVYFPTYELEQLLTLMGHTALEYNFKFIYTNHSINITDNIIVKAIKTNHIKTMSCYSYSIELVNEDKRIYYSGDSNIFPEPAKMLLYYDEIYQDTCSLDYEDNVHLSLKKLCDSTLIMYRYKIYCMHIDNDELIDKAKANGFNVVEIDKG